MASILVGDWNCTFHEIMPSFDDPSMLSGRNMFALLLGTSKDFMQNLEEELLKDIKMKSLDFIVETIVEWRSRNPETATLGALYEILKARKEWVNVKNSVKKFIAQKAESWDGLVDELKHDVLENKVEFLGKISQVKNLEYWYQNCTGEWNDFLSAQIDTYIIEQVINGEVLKFIDLEKGFFKGTVTEMDNPSVKIGENILGTGCGNTVVYKGKFGKMDVAVKKILNFRVHDEAENEIKFLLKCKGHPNVVIYHGSEKQGDLYLLALELCHEKTLKDWIQDSDCLNVHIESLDILKQATTGLSFLHEKNIIHRDLKPSNILFLILEQHVFVKLADFGISRLLPPGEVGKTVTSYGGSCGWTAPEMLEAKQIYNESGSWTTPGIPKLSKKTDIFSLGCIFYTVLTQGRHPFGADHDLRDYNVKTGNAKIATEDGGVRLKSNIDLINKMISKAPAERPDAKFILTHPILWSNHNIINFIVQVSSIVHKSCISPEQVKSCVEMFENSYFHKISYEERPELGWLVSLSDCEENVLWKFCEYYKGSAFDLVRAIRNINSHYDQKNFKDIRNIVGEKPHAFINFWLDNFPTLIIELKDAFSGVSTESAMRRYYGLDTSIDKKKK